MATKEMTNIQLDVEVVNERLVRISKWAKENLKYAEQALAIVKENVDNPKARNMMEPMRAEIHSINNQLFSIKQFLESNFGKDLPGGALSNFIRCCGSIEAQDEELQALRAAGAFGTKYPKGRVEFWQTGLNALAGIIDLVTGWQKGLISDIERIAKVKTGNTYKFSGGHTWRI